MSYIDTHTHLYKEYYPEDIHSVVKRAIHADVTKMILPAVNADSISDIFGAKSVGFSTYYVKSNISPQGDMAIDADYIVDDFKKWTI